MTQIALDSELFRLIRETRNGSAAALNEICLRLRPDLLQHCRRRFPGRLRAKTAESDLVQEALLSVAQSFVTFRGQTAAEFFVWVTRILDNKSLEFQRYLEVEKRDITREKRLTSENSSKFCLILDAISGTPLEKLVSAEETIRLQQLIAQLPETYRQVIRLRHADELSFPQIAIQLQRTEPSIKNIYVRAMEILERRIKQDS